MPVQKDRDPLSTALRGALNAIQSGAIAEGLAQLDSLVAGTSSNQKLTKILSVVGDAYMRQAKYAEAAQTYQKAESYCLNDPRGWLRPSIGQLEANFASGQYETALAKAKQIATEADRQEKLHFQMIAQASSATASGIPFLIQGVPFRCTVILVRLGNIFLKNGFIDDAQDFLNQAISLQPNGCSRGRLGLAELAARKQNWNGATSYALDAIKVGDFRRKTLSAISVYIRSSTAIGNPADISLLTSAFNLKKKSLRDRAYFILISELRRSSDPRWKETAEQWKNLPGNKSPVLACEIAKLFLSESKLNIANPADRTSKAENLLGIAGLSFSEWSFAARESVKASTGAMSAKAAALIIDATQRYGQKYKYLAVHRLARAAMEAGNSLLAKSLLSEALTTVSRNDRAWAKISWFCGRLEEEDNNPVAAANYFQAIVEEPSIAPRFQVPAMISWARNAVQAGQTQALIAKKEILTRALDSSNDYQLLLDTARLLIDASGELNDLVPQTFSRGQKLAEKAIKNSKSAADARRAWTVLVRRLADFNKNAAIVDLWANSTDAFKEWIWGPDDGFWESVDCVIRAYRRVGNPSEALSIATMYFNDPSTPECGIARMGVQTGLTQLNEGSSREAIQSFARVAITAPGHVMTSYAFYWMALNFYSKGQYSDASAMASKIKLCLGNAPRLFWQKSLKLRGVIIESRLDIASVNATVKPDQQRAVKEEYDRIIHDLSRI